MSELKDCMFQYATRHRVLVDTDLITKSEAIELFNKNKEDFKKRLDLGEEPEMALWVNCKDNSSYGDTLQYWDSDLKLIDGRLYKPV